MKNLYNTNFILGEGPIPCKIMLIGEAPGKEEDVLGRPFCGTSGRRLNALLKSSGIERKQVYITNAVKQRPPENRKPTLEEIRSHRKYLIAEIEMVKPKVIVTLGKTALESLKDHEIIALYPYFKKFLVQQGVRVFPTYHPSAVLRDRTFLFHLEETFKRLVEYAK